MRSTTATGDDALTSDVTDVDFETLRREGGRRAMSDTMTPDEETRFETLCDAILGACQGTKVPAGAGADTQAGALVVVAIRLLVADLDVEREDAAVMVGRIAGEVAKRRAWPWV